MNLLSIFLMQPTGEQGNPITSLLPLVAVVFIFYFFMIRPQMKKQKEVRQFREALAKGDKVLTVGGIYGKIVEIKDVAVILEIADGVRIKVDKAGLVKDNSDVTAPVK
jgi:preprotein translocase subunit YajC